MKDFIGSPIFGGVIMFIVVLVLGIYGHFHPEIKEGEENVFKLTYADSVRLDPEFYLNEIGDSAIKYIEEGNQKHVVTATVYNPVKSQCDNDPLITADGSKIDLKKLENGELKWIAISRELREFYKYGDKVKLTFPGHSELNGEYLVKDTMNKRFIRRIDLLVPKNIKLGKWEHVIIEPV